MEEYLSEHRRAFGVTFNTTSVSLSKAAAAETPPESYNRSLSSSFSSITSQEVGDFISDFRNAYYGLRIRKSNGLLTKDDLGEVLFLLDQEPAEDMLCELFGEMDKEKRGVIEVEPFLDILDKRLNPHVHRAITPKSFSSSPSKSTSSAAAFARLSSAATVAAAPATCVGTRASTTTSTSSAIISPPVSARGKRSNVTSLVTGKSLREELTSSGSSSSSSRLSGSGGSSRKQQLTARSQPMVLGTFAHMDLADTL